MDFIKHLIPAAFSILMMLAFDISVFTDESSVLFFMFKIKDIWCGIIIVYTLWMVCNSI